MKKKKKKKKKSLNFSFKVLVLCIVIQVMPNWALGWLPGSVIYHYQETLYWSVSCKRRLRQNSRDGNSILSSKSQMLLMFLHCLQVHLTSLISMNNTQA